MPLSTSAQRDHIRVESHPPWILGTELSSSAGAVDTVNPEPFLQFPHPTSSFEAGITEGSLIKLGWLHTKLWGILHFCLLSAGEHTPCRTVFMWVLGIKGGSSCLSDEHFPD